MLLAIDAGNTNIKLGVYQGPTLRAKWRLIPEYLPGDEYGTELLRLFEGSGLDVKDVEAIIIASVVPQLNDTLRMMSERYLQLTPRQVDHTTTVMFGYDQPSQLGRQNRSFRGR